jgi:hypothetical protein
MNAVKQHFLYLCVLLLNLAVSLLGLAGCVCAIWAVIVFGPSPAGSALFLLGLAFAAAIVMSPVMPFLINLEQAQRVAMQSSTQQV